MSVEFVDKKTKRRKASKILVLIQLFIGLFIMGIIATMCTTSCPPRHPRYPISEAKNQLISLFNTEIGTNADYDTYSTCLFDIGYEKSPSGHYIIGFALHDEASIKILKSKGTRCTGDSFYVPDRLLSPNKELLIRTLKKQKQRFSKNTFTAYAIGNFEDAKSEADLDIWSITETKLLTHVQDGRHHLTRNEKISEFFSNIFK